MARVRKVFISRKSYFITFRAESGLLLPSTELMNRILEGILCKAASLYKIEVVAFKFMANHVHMIVTVVCPESVDNFVQYVKRESAHAVNRLLGRRKRTVWCEGYDSPVFLDQDKLIEKLVYLYTNAAESDISDSVDQYPGLSSWKMFKSGDYSIKRKRIRRDSIPVIGTNAISLSRQEELISELEDSSVETNTFTLSPYAFLKGFDTDSSEEEIKAEIINRVQEKEEEFRRKRTKPLPSLTRLKTSGIKLDYTPKKFGKRMICLGSDREERVEYISWYRRLCEKAASIYREFKNKLHELRLPPGLFSPGGYLTANIWAAPS